MGDAKGHLPLWMADHVDVAAEVMSFNCVVADADVTLTKQGSSKEPTVRISFKTEAFTFKVSSNPNL